MTVTANKAECPLYATIGCQSLNINYNVLEIFIRHKARTDGKALEKRSHLKNERETL